METAQCHSFLPGTGVLLADGTSKPIEEVGLGDKVTVTDPETGETTVREVVATIVTEDDKHFVDLTIAAGEGSAALISTATHPFWVESEQEWIEAGDLEPGMELRTPDGDTVTLTGIRHFEKRQRTHDLTIAGIHTYYVLAGVEPVLVHNTNTAAPGSCPVNGTRFSVDSRGVVQDLNADMKRAKKPFTRSGKRKVREKSRENNGGRTVCDDCGVETVPAKRSQKGVPPNLRETRIDHIWPESLGGPGAPWNGRVTCVPCNGRWSNTPKGKI
ncbi:hypothetical protein L7D48_02290 [Streptomyces sp. S1A]|uniref:polymorphic toxin-type HINT domain-containing protein n=1 Tax=Streptomyces sp. ICN903 TaxID=2964654 RepID=UPI001EDA5B82|nr:polymorphic toxin-type HINT domain-containing protein [Streptomyces sp. ICN903]MCG3039411.1 hypothetical protein [Streptomyces sp. ICN903]